VERSNDFDIWKQSLDGSIILDKDKYPKLKVSFDMAWQQRSTSENRYASLSVHALFVGGVTRRPIALQIKCKLGNYCKWWKKKHPPIDGEEELPPLPHTCYANHQGSSGSMEPMACLDLTIMMYEKFKCVIDLICDKILDEVEQR
jgi:hypothetical protein